jgi:hypothetical protein
MESNTSSNYHQQSEVFLLPDALEVATSYPHQHLLYNWPFNLENFVTYQYYYEFYMQFSYNHREHQDPVCFRVAIFIAILGFGYNKYEFVEKKYMSP